MNTDSVAPGNGEVKHAEARDGGVVDAEDIGADARAESASNQAEEADALPERTATKHEIDEGRSFKVSQAGSEEGQTVSVVSTQDAGTPASPRLAIFGVGADVGIPDGANLSLVVRPLKWARFQVGLGSNGIGHGVRIGASVVPLREGPGLVAEYGHYWDGDANGFAARLAGEGYHPTPTLDRVGYDYFNLHLGLNFGYRHVTFFVQGGLSVVRGHLTRSDPTAYGPSNVQLAFLREPSFRSTGMAGKLGLLVYLW